MRKRGCGFRSKGGIYACTDLSPSGVPVESFLLDPPTRFEATTKVGVTPVKDAKGVVHVLDYVGKQHYSYPADFIEETRGMGVSRRIAKTFDFSLLTTKSRLILIHDMGSMEVEPKRGSKKTFDTARLGSRQHHCQLWLKHDDEHIKDLMAPCSGDHWNVGGLEIREFNDWVCRAWPLPEDTIKKFHSAIFMAVPIHRIVGISSDNEAHLAAFEKVKGELRDIPFDIEDE